MNDKHDVRYLGVQTLFTACLFILLAGGSPATTAHAETQEERLARLQRMDPEQKQQVAQNHERFGRLDLAEQQRLRQLDAALATALDGENLRKVMQRYHDWLNELPLGQRAEILSLPREERVKKIAEVIRTSRARQERRLSDSDLEIVAKWFHDHQEEIGRLVVQRRSRGADAPVTTPEDLEKMLTMLRTLRDSLSEDARQKLDRAETPDEKRQLVRAWVGQIWRHNSQSGQPWFRRPSDEDLRNFLLNELTEEQRKQLQSMTPEEMRYELWRRWMAKEGRNFPRDQGRDGGPGRGRPPRGRESFGERRPLDRSESSDRPKADSGDSDLDSPPARDRK